MTIAAPFRWTPAVVAPASHLVLRSAALWVLLWALISGIVLTCEDRNETREYRGAALRWLCGEPLYGETGHGFLYLPQAAVLFIPWAVLPNALGEIAWRFCNLAAMAVATASLCRCAAPHRWPRVFWIASLTAVPVCYAAARNGQMTLLMGGLMLQAIADLSAARWNRSACLLLLAFAAKPIALPALLLAAALWPRPLLPRLALGGLLLLAAPLACQSPQYALEQYREFPRMLQAANAVGHREVWAQLFGMLWTFGLHVPDAAQTALRVVAAIATLGAAWIAQRNLSPRQFALFLATLASGYILLFNPRTMVNTYALIAPAIGCYVALWQPVRPWSSRAAYALTWLMIGSFELGKLLMGKPGVNWLAPAATIVFLSLCVGITGALRRRPGWW